MASLASGGTDCDDSSDAAYPGAPDTVGDGVDQGCDGIDGVDGDGDGFASTASGGADCDDSPTQGASVFPGAPDGVGNAIDSNCDGVDGVDDDGDGWAVNGEPPDCNDDPGDPAAPGTFPGADDNASDGLDTDCDGVPGVDGDGDSHASLASGGDDCDDGAPATFPGAADAAADGVDTDCDGLPGVDQDGDGFASVPSGGDDCDDSGAAAAERFPGAPDAWGDGVDQDCDGADGVDADGDGHASLASGGDDCNDDGSDPAAASTWPGAADALDDSIDNDCDGVNGVDADRDGIASLASGGDDCDDGSDATFPGAADFVGDGIDRNCDDVDGIDADGDGFPSIPSGGDDCNDDDTDPRAASMHPGALDSAADGVDADCDGVPGVDADGDGFASVGSGGDDCDESTAHSGATWPGAPDPAGDGIDTDCDGTDGVDADGDGVASVASGGADCNDDPDDPLAPATRPGAADLVGNGADTDCDGVDGVDADGDGHAGQGSGGPDCDDGAAATHPGATDSVGDGVDQDCDGIDGVDGDGDGVASEASGGADCDDGSGPIAAITFPGAADPWSDGADTNCDGEDGIDQDGDGHPVNAVGDVDCDDDDPDAWPGNESRWESPADGVDLNCDGVVYEPLDGADLIGDGDASSGYFGRSIAGLGDLDGDGLGEVLVAAPKHSGLSGRVYFFRGADLALGGPAPADAHALLQGASSEGLGSAMHATGDLTGDGVPDVVIGAPGWDGSRGRVYIVSGARLLAGEDFTSATAFASVSGDAGDEAVGVAESDWIGAGAIATGDFDGDGQPDLALGGPRNGGLQPNWGGGWRPGKDGRLYVFFGPSLASGGDRTVTAADRNILGAAPGDEFGTGVTTLGDLDGDGKDELAVSAIRNDDGGSDAGQVYVFSGASLTAGTATPTSPWASVAGQSSAGTLLGSSIASVADFDGDGRRELVIGQSGGLNPSGIMRGVVSAWPSSLLTSGATLASTAAPTSFWGETGATAKSAVSAIGDVDGDGTEDVLVGGGFASPSGTVGGSWLILGSRLAAGGGASSITGVDHVLYDLASTGNGSAAPVGARVGDLDGDGLADLLLGMYLEAANGLTSSGRAYLLFSRYDDPAP